MHKDVEIYALALDPIYIGTGGYKIGRVDNTIVRDPSTNEPKIPGSSLAGVWRYYSVLRIAEEIRNNLDNEFNEIVSYLKDKGALNDEEVDKLKDQKDKLNFFFPKSLLFSVFTILNLSDSDKDKKDNIKNAFYEYLSNHIFKNNGSYIFFEGNRFIGIKCAGQDDAPNLSIEDVKKEDKPTGHCGSCIVCKSFGFSKKDLSWQGLIFFSDLEILFFPVFTYKGTKWVTTKKKLERVGVNSKEPSSIDKILAKESDYLNLGWLYLKVEGDHEIKEEDLKKLDLDLELKPEDIVIVSEELFSQIVNSNLEVRTSVSIDPITGAAKEGALFTSEAIPRGTIFFGKIRIFDKTFLEGIEEKIKPIPETELIENMLEDSKNYFEIFGIGGMTTRGFGRLKIALIKEKNGEQENSEDGQIETTSQENGE
ncbi:RAMP superfamily CRISPR-associated protein [Methanocaldococcus infernus]